MSAWDPIGVNDVPEAADEYDSYIGGLYELLELGASEESIRAYLQNIEMEAMEMVKASGEALCPAAKRTAAAASTARTRPLFPLEFGLRIHQRSFSITAIKRSYRRMT